MLHSKAIRGKEESIWTSQKMNSWNLQSANMMKRAGHQVILKMYTALRVLTLSGDERHQSSCTLGGA